MNEMDPITLEEWDLYLAGLLPEQLWSKAKAMNRIQFVRTLEEEGFRSDYIEGVFRAFSRRFLALGLEPPTGGYVDLKEILSE
jgi:hypothetical protein